MSQSFKTIHDFQSLNVGQSILDVTSVTNTLTLTPKHSGDIISLDSTSGCAITLPTPTPGCLFQFVVNNTGPHTITAPSACINGSIVNSIFNTGSNLATSTPKTVISTTTGSAVGDTFTLTANSTKYFLKGTVAQFNAVQYT